jgi:hypothetical protein
MKRVQYCGYKKVELMEFKYYRPYFSDIMGKFPRYSRKVFKTATAARQWGERVAARFPIDKKG